MNTSTHLLNDKEIGVKKRKRITIRICRYINAFIYINAFYSHTRTHTRVDTNKEEIAITASPAHCN